MLTLKVKLHINQEDESRVSVEADDDAHLPHRPRPSLPDSQLNRLCAVFEGQMGLLLLIPSL